MQPQELQIDVLLTLLPLLLVLFVEQYGWPFKPFSWNEATSKIQNLCLLLLDACAHVVKYGNIINTMIFTATQTGKIRGQGITFLQASEVDIQWKSMSVFYHLFQMRGRPVHAKPASEKAATSGEPPATPAQSDATPAASKDTRKKARRRPPVSIAKKAGVNIQTNMGHSSAQPPAAGAEIRTNTTESHWGSTFETLQVLYDAEKECREATQVENELLRVELASAKTEIQWRESIAAEEAERALLEEEWLAEERRVQAEKERTAAEEAANSSVVAERLVLRKAPSSSSTSKDGGKDKKKWFGRKASGNGSDDKAAAGEGDRSTPALQALYDTERKCRITTQAENESLRAELASVKQQGDAKSELLLQELESVTLQGEAEIELLKEKLESTKRALDMAESRLRMLQLEADRPLWETAKKKRESNERAERAKEEERRRTAEVEESRRKMREFQEQEKARKSAAEKERMRRDAEEKARRDKEEQEREQREKAQRERERRWKAATEAEEARCHKRDEQMFGTGAWTPVRALERLKLQIAEFDKIKFSEAQPLTFRVIPWPVLTDPLDLGIEQIDWSAVEAFFTRVKIQLASNGAEYNSLVEKVHRLFHPDKWKSRNLLVTVMDKELRNSLETAGNLVAQAMTPIWRKSRGHSDT